MKSPRFVPALALILPLTAQSPEPPPDVTLRTTVQQVLLDFIARDRSQKLVRTLQPADVEVFEDGVKQDIKSFRFVGGETGRLEAGQPNSAPAKPVAVAPRQQVKELNLVCLVFDSLTPDSRVNARDAAAYFLKNEMRGNTYAAVFAFGPRLYAISPFTQEQVTLQAAVQKATSSQFSAFSQDSQAIARQAALLALNASAGKATPTNPAVRNGGFIDASTANSGTLADILKNLEHIQDTAATANLLSLMHMMTALGKQPGRKTVLLFSQGLVLNPNQLEILREAISIANRNNVSVYAVDVLGLRTQQPGGVRRAISTNTQPTADPNSPGNVTTAEGIKEGGHDGTIDAADIVRDNIQENLRDLAESTGGFLIANTNDFARSITRIVEDVNTHYELTYSPTSGNLDGHFRKIEIKLKPKGLKVQSRSGYFALPTIPGKPTLSYEKDLLTALDSLQPPHDFAFSAAAYRFRPGPTTQIATAFETPAANLQWNPAPNNQSAAHLSFIALIRDETNQVVEKLSRDLPLQVPADRVKDYQMISITLNLTLPPGHYTVDWAAADRNSKKIGTKRHTLVIPRLGGLTMSQPFVARRLDKLADGQSNPTDPLQFMNQRLTPSVDGNIVPATRPEIPIYFVVYPPKDQNNSPEPTKLRIDIMHNGEVVTSAEPPLPPAASDGTLPFLALIPTSGLDPGKYEVRITATQGDLAAQETTLVNIM